MNNGQVFCATVVLQEIISTKFISESSRIQEMRIINSFKKFLDTSNTGDYLYNMTLSTLENYQNFLLALGRKVKTIHSYTSTLIHLLRLVSRHKEYNYSFSESGLADFRPLPNKIPKTERKKKQIALTDEEVVRLYKFPLERGEKEIRDIFVCQCLLGQRIGDMARLFAREFTVETVNNVEVISFIQEKTNERAVIPLLPIAKEILTEYKDGFRHIKFSTNRFDNYINRKIKIIGKKVGLDKDIQFLEQRGNSVTQNSLKQYELLHTHTARHTFITIMCRLGVKKETIIIATGHTDTKMIDEVYSHLNNEDNTKAIVEAFSGLKGKIYNMGNYSEELPAISGTHNVNNINPSHYTVIIVSDYQKVRDVLAYLEAPG